MEELTLFILYTYYPHMVTPSILNQITQNTYQNHHQIMHNHNQSSICNKNRHTKKPQFDFWEGFSQISQHMLQIQSNMA